ncbi:MAG TPA: cytidylate kinase family protein [Syntrophomonas sp.]|nr:cytidylate kinase family protein [Syntrophomonas sp.]HRW11865.1 cytidylate kinase family protein [Syntrophomonas sp.]
MLITVSRETGSLGREITDLLAMKLDLPVITRDLVMNQWFPEIADKHELHMLSESPRYFLNTSAEGITYAAYLENRLKAYAAQHSAIVFGLGAQMIFAGQPGVLHVKIMASPQIRNRRLMQSLHIGEKEAQRFLELTDRKHRRYIATLYERDWADPTLYHLMLNTDCISEEEGAEVLAFMARHLQLGTALPAPAADEDSVRQVVFKHPSEAEFATILDMHHIQWEYEPRTFPVQWDTEGNVTQAFAPDFYLPRFDTYIELTTMDQKYVSQKKKKVRMLQKLYPDININIVFKNDFYHLAERFGLRKGEDD